MLRFICIFSILVGIQSFDVSAKGKLFDLEVFADTTLSNRVRFDAIFHIRDVPYKANQQAIQDFVSKLEADCGNTPNLCCDIAILKTRFIYVDRNYVEFIPKAIEILEGDCELALRDSVLMIWSLAKSIENGGAFLESVKYRRIIENLLPRYLKLYPDHVQYMSNMSGFYYTQGKFAEAMVFFKKHLKYLEDNDQVYYLGTLSNSIGVCYNKLNEPDSAISYFNSALAYFKKYNEHDSAYIHGLIKGNIAQSYILRGNFKEAIPLLLLDVEGSRVLEPRNAFTSMLELAKCYVHVDSIDKSMQYLDTLKSYESIDMLPYRANLDYLKVKAEIFEASGMPDSAISSLRRIIEIVEINDRKIAINQSAVLVAIYGVTEKQKIIDKQKIENHNVQLELVEKSRNQILTIGISAAILMVLIIVLLAHNKVTKQKRELHEKNEINKSSLEEKEVLLKEIHHRVKNNLQVVSGLLHLQSSKIDSPELLAMVEEGQQRIESMALIHQMLYQDDNDVSVIECQDYLEQLIGQIEHSYGSNKSINISIHAEGMKLGFDYAIPLGLIINELTVNSFKYAFPDSAGEIKIEISYCEQKRFNVLFTDNGIGLPNIDAIESVDSLGLRLVRMFCEEMDANLSVSNTPGATFEIFFKGCKKNEGEG